ncbi:response regulator transcription factor [Paenibacillus sp. J5C_2022]|uniref:response regulator transcription factor n=1 Tax=Paenibacillus sp. J5C2022 TaxID=2977129 RepID=UPI0021CF6BA7|nr:response regulator transcription factor [Paenibacillus sp. J5C2022]MCU6710232.1 response regulator transcription factor [Paenibacillus sp. J5C2022]
MDSIRIVVADDIEDIRNYFRMILDRETDIEVIAMAGSGEEAVEVVREGSPDVVLMDIEMETPLAGIDAIGRIKAEWPEVKIIVLTIHEEDDVLFQAYGAGAVDYIVKTSSIADILNSIRSAHRDRLYMRPEIAEKILGEFSKLQNEKNSLIYTLNIMSRLTDSEFAILTSVYEGATYKEIAKSRYVEEVTIRTQVNKILKKFKMRSMKEVMGSLHELKVFDIYKRRAQELGVK